MTRQLMRSMAVPLVFGVCSTAFAQTGVTGLPAGFPRGEIGADGAPVGTVTAPTAPAGAPTPAAQELTAHQDVREAALQRMEQILRTSPKYVGFQSAHEVVATKMAAVGAPAPQSPELKNLTTAAQKIVDLGRRINGNLKAPDIVAIINEFDVALQAVEQLKGANPNQLAADLMVALVPGFTANAALGAIAPDLLKTFLSRLRVFDVITQASPNSVTQDARAFNNEAQNRQLYSRLQRLTQ